MAKNYVYYSTQRPIGPGTFPKEGMVTFRNYSRRTPIYGVGMVWGFLYYNRELTIKEMADYELKWAGEVNE